MLLEHKKAVVYGAAGAIGGAVARTFAHEGADLFLAGRTKARVESVAEEISAAGGVAEAAEVDALDEDAIEKHMDDVVARAQRIDVLFNAIGMDDVQGTLLVDMSAEDFAQPVIKATRTQFLTARAAARRMVRQGSGDHVHHRGSHARAPPRGVRGRVRRSRRAVAEFRRGARTTRDPARHPAVGRVSGRVRHQADLRASRPGRRDLSRGVLGRGEQRDLASASSDAVGGGRGRGHHGVGSCQRDDRGHGQRHVRVLGRRVSPALTTDAARQPRRRTGGSGHG
jgi:NADP-dependent 3-hydroxy acid dehydrogenase YdfG